MAVECLLQCCEWLHLSGLPTIETPKREWHVKEDAIPRSTIVPLSLGHLGIWALISTTSIGSGVQISSPQPLILAVCWRASCPSFRFISSITTPVLQQQSPGPLPHVRILQSAYTVRSSDDEVRKSQQVTSMRSPGTKFRQERKYMQVDGMDAHSARQ